MTDTWLIEVEFEDGEVFTHRTHKNPHDAGWECVFPCAVAIRFIPLSPAPAHTSPGESVAAPAQVEQGQGTSFQIKAAQTALICVRQALLISQTTEEQCACMAAFAAQAQRVMQLSGREIS